jgi:DNA primase
MENQVEEIKKKLNIVDIVSEHVALKKKGKNHVGLCPFHGEKTGSFMVNEELQIYKCFGCGAGGDVYKFLMEVEGLDFSEALEKLAGKAGVKLAERKNENRDGKRELLEVHSLATEYYHYLLTKHAAGEVARKYLADRGIGEKLIETFKIGYALPEWDGLSSYLVEKKKYRPEVLVAAGLASAGRGKIFDRFRGRVMFPLFDISGRVVGFSGRILPVDKDDPHFAEASRGEEAKYINSPETTIYHKSKMLFGLTIARSEIKKKKRAVIVEGELDMISSFAAGVAETVAIKGSALTEEMMDMLSRLTSSLVLALDADAAGEAAMKRSIESAEKRGLSIKMVEMVGGKDPDEIARKKPHEWVEMVEKAVPIYEFFFNKAIGRWGTDSVESIGRIVKEVVPYLAKVENSVIREVWAKKLAERIGVDKQRVYEEIEKSRMGRPSIVSEKPNQELHSSRGELDLKVVGLLLTISGEQVEKVKKMLSGLPLMGAVGKLVGLIFETGEVVRPDQFIGELPEELRDLAAEAYMVGNSEETEDKEVAKLFVAWAKAVIHEERAILSLQIKEEEKRGNDATIGNLGEKLVKLNILERKLAAV